MAIVCFDHPQVLSAGTCTRCGLGLCASCAGFQHPPICQRCFTAGRVRAPRSFAAAPKSASGDELEAIQSRAATAGILGGLGGFTTWSLCSLFAYIGVGAGHPWGALIASHDLSVIGLGAYIIGSAPYGWFIAGGWLVPPDRYNPIARAQTMRSATLATITVGPFFAPAGIIHDVRRLFQLRGTRTRAKMSASVSVVSNRLDMSDHKLAKTPIPQLDDAQHRLSDGALK